MFIYDITEDLMNINEAAWTYSYSLKHFKFQIVISQKLVSLDSQCSLLYIKAWVAITRLCTLIFEL